VTDRKPPPRHPSTLIPDDLVREAAYRIYLLRLEPPMTPEQSALMVTRDSKTGKVTGNDATRRKASESMLPWVRNALRVLVDLEMIYGPAQGEQTKGPTT